MTSESLVDILPEDIIGEIVVRVPIGWWKPFIFTCKAFYRYNSQEIINKHVNHLWTIVSLLNHEDWSIADIQLSSNPGTTFNVLKNYDYYYWLKGNLDWGILSKKQSIPYEAMFYFPSAPWDIQYMKFKNTKTLFDNLADFVPTWNWHKLSMLVPLDIILANLDKPWHWSNIVDRSDIPLDTIANNMHLPWKDSYINREDTVTIDDLIRYPQLKWDYENISASKNITMDMIEAHPEIPWYYVQLSNNPNITCEFIKRHIDEDWDYDSLSHNTAVTIDFVLALPDGPWDLRYLTENASITTKDILNNSQFPWDWEQVVENRGDLTFKDIVDHPEIPWDWAVISESDIITREDVFSNPNLPWDWELLGLGGHLMLDDILTHYDKIEYPMGSSYYYISYATDLTVAYITEHINEDWDWYTLCERFPLGQIIPLIPPRRDVHLWCYISKLPGLTYDVVRDNIDRPWSPIDIAENKFNFT